MKSIEALRTFFETPTVPLNANDEKFAAMFPPRKITMDEFKQLSIDERKELAELAARALGVQLEASK